MLIAVQTLANLGVAMGLLPTKGLVLPFVSYGGSALVISLFGAGIFLNISRPHSATQEESPSAERPTGNRRRTPKPAMEEA